MGHVLPDLQTAAVITDNLHEALKQIPGTPAVDVARAIRDRRRTNLQCVTGR